MSLRRIPHREPDLAFAGSAVHGVAVRHLPALILCGVPGLVLVALDRPRLAWGLWFAWLGAALWAPAPWGWLIWLGCLVINTAGLLSIRDHPGTR